jgi:predicted glycosyltransferase
MKPALLFYCQHSLGMGHLVRSFALARALAGNFHVVFLNGGRMPENRSLPAGVEMVQLPPLGMEAGGQLVSLDPRYTVESAKIARRLRLLECLAHHAPQVIVIELFPFGRKKFADELLPLLERARNRAAPSPLIICSLRDILVGARHDQQRHDDRAAELAATYFDAVLVHADPSFARLEESFHPIRSLAVPVHYTGFVAAKQPAAANACRQRRVLVSAGSGIAGAPLFRAALAAQEILWRQRGLPMVLVAGPFLPEADWRELEHAARDRNGLELIRSVSDLGAKMDEVSLSVSQCGYNSAMDIIGAKLAALVVPFATGRENEQMNRARRLEQRGLLRVLEPDRLDGPVLARAIEELETFRPNPAGLDLDGAARSAELVNRLLAQRPCRVPAPPALAAS